MSVRAPQQESEQRGLSMKDKAVMGVYTGLTLYSSAFGWYFMAGKSPEEIASVTTVSWVLLAALKGNRDSAAKLLTCMPLESIDKAKLVNLAVALFACLGVGFTLADTLSMTAVSYGLQSATIAAKTENMRVVIPAAVAGLAYGGVQYLKHPDSSEEDKLDTLIVALQVSNMINLAYEIYTVRKDEQNQLNSATKSALQCLFAGIFSFNVFAITTHEPALDSDPLNDTALTVASLLVLFAIIRLEYISHPSSPSPQPDERVPLLKA